MENWFWIIHTLAVGYIGFYYGMLYGEGVWRWARYWRLRAIRWKQGRHLMHDKVKLQK